MYRQHVSQVAKSPNLTEPQFLQLENGVMSQVVETNKQNKVPKMGENSSQLLHVSSLEHSWEVGSLIAEPH